MKPYYDDGKGIQIYHGKSEHVLPNIPRVNLVMTDPPYGINRDGGRMSTSSHGGRKPYKFRGWDVAIPDKSIFDWIFSNSDEQCIWGGNYFVQYLPPKMGWLVWDKGQDICSSDCELAFTSRDGALRRLVLNRCAIAEDGAVHPTQKPIKLITWSLSFFPDAKTIIDPFMGSGTTLRAAKDLGKSAIGIDAEEEFCEIAANRLQQEVFKL